MSNQTECVTFNNGNKFPIIGLGTWKSKEDTGIEAVKTAIDVGYRHFDTAPVYGNEKEIGQAIKIKINEGVIKREDIFITSKLWNTKHRPALVEPALRKTLSDLDLEYLDLYLIHWPQAFKESDEAFPTDEAGKTQFGDVDFVDTWKAMEEVAKKGLAKNIGISNFNSKQIERILESCSIKPVVNQIECHPYLPQILLSEFCKSKNIIITTYSPLGSPDRPWAQPGDPTLLEDPRVQEIAKRINKSPAQVLLRYQIQRGHMIIPKSKTKQRMEENLKLFDFELSNDDIQLLHTFDRNWRVCSMQSSIDHKDYPFHEKF